MTRVVLVPDLDQRVAEKIGRPALDRALARMRDRARLEAPVTRVWVTMRDERVRTSHVRTDGQAIPDNLRFKVPKVNAGNDANDVRFGFDLARFPRDADLPIGNRINCRCSDPVVPNLLKDSIHSTGARIAGSRVTGEVYTNFPRAAESERGTDGDQAAYFMRKALDAELARWRR